MTLTWRCAKPVPLDLNGPADRPYAAPPTDFAERPLYRLLMAGAAHDPDASAIADPHERLSYRELLRRVRYAARNVARIGSGPVAVLLANTPSMVAVLLGCLVARRLVLLLDPQQPAERNAAMLSGSGATALLCADDAADLPATHLLRISPAELFRGADEPDWQPADAFAPDDPAMVFFTSGSTGRPKGIVVSLWALLFRASLMIDAMHAGTGDRMLNCSQATANSSIARYLAILCVGGRLVLYQPGVDGIGAMAERLRDESITILIANPPLMRTVLSLPQLHDAFATVQVVRSAAAALLQADIDAMRQMLPPACRIDTTYASTEAGIVAGWVIPRECAYGPRVPSGYLVPGLEFALIDAVDGVGELVVRGRGVAAGEWQDGGCVPGRLTPDDAHPGWRIFRTGDLVRIDDDDLLRFVSRADQQVKINGVRIEPAEIEAVLRREPGVADTVVVARTDGMETRLVGYVASDADPDALLPMLRLRLRAELPTAMHPAHLVVLKRLPRLSGGKLDLGALPDP